ncbi:MAG: hypothetical protein ABEN55_14685, partial [Bradymonadaceae bacterium]
MNDPDDTSTRADLLTSEGDWLKYGAGNPHFRGRTEVMIRRNGRVKVTFEQKSDLETYRGELSDKRLTELRDLLRKHDPRDLPSDFESGEKGVPDEVVLTIEASVEGREVERKFWHNERHDHEGLESLVTSFEKIAGDISDGEVTY